MSICSTLTHEHAAISKLAERSHQLLDQLSQSGDKEIRRQLTNTLANIRTRKETFEQNVLISVKALMQKWKESFLFPLEDNQFNTAKIKFINGEIVYTESIIIETPMRNDSFFLPQSIHRINGNLNLTHLDTVTKVDVSNTIIDEGFLLGEINLDELNLAGITIQNQIFDIRIKTVDVFNLVGSQIPHFSLLSTFTILKLDLTEAFIESNHLDLRTLRKPIEELILPAPSWNGKVSISKQSRWPQDKLDQLKKTYPNAIFEES